MFYGGEVLGNMYQIRHEIGKGGTGVIYLAWHMHLQKNVVVKKIRDDVAERMNVRAEVDILKGLHHTCLPQVYDYLQIGSEIYTVMEYIPGNDLQYYIDHGYRFEERQIVFWLRQLCQVLSYLHNNKPKILHSDIKPGNIMITPEGNVYLIDFNISLDGQQNAELQGISPYYAAPEQYYKAQLINAGQDASGVALDGRMDIYSLGATFYRLMTGMFPEMSPNPKYPIDRLDIPYSSGLKAVIARSMQWEPGRRYGSGEAMLRALEHLHTSDATYRKYRRIHWICTAACAVLLVAGIWSCYFGWKRMSREGYEADYSEFIQACEEYDNDRIVSLALDMLNNRRYQIILDGQPEDKGQLFNQMGDVYFEQGHFDEAYDCYMDAVNAYPTEGTYYRNGAIAAARDGRPEEGTKLLEEAASEGILDTEMLLARQELAYAEQDYEETVACGEQMQSLRDPDVTARSCIVSAMAYDAMGDSQRQLQCLESAYNAGAGIRCQRELGKVCIEQAQQEDRSALKKQYLERGKACYKNLWESQYRITEDGLNLAMALELEEDYRQSMDILKELDRQDVQLYQVYMHMAYVSLKLEEQQKKGKNCTYQEARRYYDMASRLYRQQDKEDSSMEAIRDLLQQKLQEREQEEEQ